VDPALKIGNVAIDYPSPACARVRIGDPAARQTVFDDATFTALEHVLTKIEAQISLRGVIFAGAQAGRMPEGVDLQRFATFKDVAEAAASSRRGQNCFERIARMPWNTVAAIDGPCLGACLELVLACKVRIASDSARTRLGFPEVLFGVIPGYGGAARLTRIAGLTQSLAWILSGRRFGPRDAFALGVVDAVCPQETLDRTALQAAEGQLVLQPRPREPWVDRLLNRTRLGTAVFAARARKKIVTESHGRFPAPLRAIEIARAGCHAPPAAVFEREAAARAELIFSPQARELTRLAMHAEEIRLNAPKLPATVQAVAVAGESPRAAAFAAAAAAHGLVAMFADGDDGAARESCRLAARLLGSLGAAPDAAKRLVVVKSKDDGSRCEMLFYSSTTGLAAAADAVLEFKRIAPRAALVAVDPARYSISELQQKVESPDRIAGFAPGYPCEKWVAAEVIRGGWTAHETVELATALALRLGKTPIVTTDAPGFLIQRMLGALLSSGMSLLRDGLSIEEIDSRAKRCGFPSGPFETADTLGLPATRDLLQYLEASSPGAFGGADLCSRLCDAGRTGRDCNRGFYRYTDRTFRDPAVDALLGLRYASSARGPKSKDMAPRAAGEIMAAMAREARRAVERGVAASAADADLAAVLGLGFPAELGGPLRIPATPQS
jgi:3-hydroxyacyl-CoA dehydrogenase/enoyl-CoA hydratase/3-hydroxybutyryl-CoA epimerase